MSYLSSRSFRVKCNNSLSSFHIFSCGVPQSSVLGPLAASTLRRVHYPSQYSDLFSFPRPPFYADDTQLVFSFHPLNIDWSISHLQNAIQQISFWMTANHLTLNSYNTDFLLIGLKNQLAKIHNSSFDTSHSARNLIWRTSYLLWPNCICLQSLLSITFVNFAVSGLTLIRQLPVPIAILLSFTHSKLDYRNSLYYKLPKFQLSRLQQIQNSLSRTVVKVPKSSLITSHPTLSPLALNHWTHRIIGPLTYQQSSHNYSTSIPL